MSPVLSGFKFRNFLAIIVLYYLLEEISDATLAMKAMAL